MDRPCYCTSLAISHLAIEKGRRRQTRLSRENRLFAHCPQNEVETELHFLTSCLMYDHIRDTYFCLCNSVWFHSVAGLPSQNWLNRPGIGFRVRPMFKMSDCPESAQVHRAIFNKCKENYTKLLLYILNIQIIPIHNFYFFPLFVIFNCLVPSLQLPYGLGRGKGREPCVLQNTIPPSCFLTQCTLNPEASRTNVSEETPACMRLARHRSHYSVMEQGQTPAGQINDIITCSSTHVIYVIKCPCGLCYVGQNLSFSAENLWT